MSHYLTPPPTVERPIKQWYTGDTGNEDKSPDHTDNEDNSPDHTDNEDNSLDQSDLTMRMFHKHCPSMSEIQKN